MNIKRVKYKMSEDDSLKIGYIIGKYDGDNETLLDKDFQVVPKISYGEKEYLAYDFSEDIDKELNITIPI